jgi:hypothetical protein
MTKLTSSLRKLRDFTRLQESAVKGVQLRPDDFVAGSHVCNQPRRGDILSPFRKDLVMRRLPAAALAAFVSVAVCAVVAQQPAPPPSQTTAIPSDAEIEQFLRTAKVVKTRGTSKGITGSLRATLSDGTRTHDAQIQRIDERKAQFEAGSATEFNFRDSWEYNVAAYRLDRMIGLNLVPVSIARRYDLKQAAFTWWIDDVMMDEGKRLSDKIQPPRPQEWNEYMQLVRVFDQLIYNMDRNTGNLLITKDWHVWAIDHTRAFRTHPTLKTPANVTRCDRQMLERMKELTKESLKKELGEYLTDFEIAGVLARRDLIVGIIEKTGPAGVFDRRAR